MRRSAIEMNPWNVLMSLHLALADEEIIFEEHTSPKNLLSLQQI